MKNMALAPEGRSKGQWEQRLHTQLSRGSGQALGELQAGPKRFHLCDG